MNSLKEQGYLNCVVYAEEVYNRNKQRESSSNSEYKFEIVLNCIEFNALEVPLPAGMISVLSIKPGSGIVLVEEAPRAEEQVSAEQHEVEVKEDQQSFLPRGQFHLSYLYYFKVFQTSTLIERKVNDTVVRVKPQYKIKMGFNKDSQGCM